MALGPQFEQLKMFMTSQEIKGYVNHSYDQESVPDENNYLRDESMDEMWDRKLDESKEPYGEGHGGGVYNALKSGKDLWDNPDNPKDAGNIAIQLGSENDRHFRGRRTLLDAHHRIAAQAQIDQESHMPKYLPIEYEAD